MRRRIPYFLMATLHIITWHSLASWHFASHDAASGQGPIPQFKQATFDPNQGPEKARLEGAESYRGLSRLGSTPPNCGHKCGGCLPCNAIQIPATTDHKTVEYANYEPEGWKCKCGTAFFNP